MTEILLYRRGLSLLPADDLAEQDLAEMREGQPVMVKLTKPRSLPHTRLYFACIRSICQSGGFDAADHALHDVTKIGAGCFKVIQMSGLTFRIPDSVAFDKMDQVAFSAFFDRALSFWQVEKLYGWIKPDLRRKLEQGERLAA